jgi:hypothetical protein
MVGRQNIPLKHNFHQLILTKEDIKRNLNELMDQIKEIICNYNH